ncbi:putative benzoate 4-monooxygenase cytochrome P450 [Exophiala viscosa]|uniref:Benzoate 4-monooxygenase cytochrome P450 n=1 Tax=Exophiala viscosa TaxID=2486360 RepID=A0AAN6DZT3_9EURO|nr:putative benzoate 4-monooxygenase cytochrome P450 [Exophiala viscosa]
MLDPSARERALTIIFTFIMPSEGMTILGLPIALWVVLATALYAATAFTQNAVKLRKIPGPWSYAATTYRLALDAWQARSVHAILDLHQRYGHVVRIGPKEVSFNSLSALRTIYGAGSGFERTDFYRMFDVYGRPNLFTFGSGKLHRERKKLVSHIYANQTVLGSEFSGMVQRKVGEYLGLLEKEPGHASEIFRSLHYFSFDAISEFVYGPDHGGTTALTGCRQSQGLIQDILNPARRRLAWFAVHFPAYTKWITTRTGVLERLLTSVGLMPMKKPFTYSGIRQHALQAFHRFKQAPKEVQAKAAETTVIGRLFKVREEANLSDMDIASECADHLLAGIDTTADSLMFMIWALSLPQNKQCQEKLREEVLQISVADQNGIPTPKDLTHLPYLNAVVKEALRLYSPLPAFEPRVSPTDTLIDGFEIPAGTIVGMSPFCLHRDEAVFPDPLSFRPERWLTPGGGTLVPESDLKNKYLWAFSSGARMCIGMHLANAEMLTMLAALYRKYSTTAKHPDTSPGITSRFEVFYDENAPKMEEHECWIDFKKLVDGAATE